MASTDREALIALFRLTCGYGWSRRGNWGTDAELATWDGVQVNGQGRVVKLGLAANNLQGPIPPALGKLAALQDLYLNGNQLSGPIPPALGKLAALQHLSLYGNQLSGAIPPELGGLGKLEILWLQNNQLAGPIPPELGELAALTSLYLSNNQLTGPIPLELGHLSALKELALVSNQLSGHIPPQLGNLGALQDLYLSRNKLDGPIPPALGKLAALQDLHLYGNQLSGPIPPELGNLSALQHLCLQGNHLSALWDHTQNVQDVDHKERGHSMPGGPMPSQLCRLLDIFDSVEAQGLNDTGIGPSLSLSENPWAEPPESIVAKGPKSIRGYFEDLYAEHCRIKRRGVKVVLVGQEGAGKTSLRQSMKANKATLTGEWKENSTVLADVESMELEGSSVRVYDCAGQVTGCSC